MSTDTEKDDPQDIILLLIILPFAIIYDVWAWGITIAHAYSWLVVPAYDAAPLTHRQVVALAALYVLIRFAVAKTGSTNGKIKWEGLIYKVINPWFALLMAWFIKSVFM